MRNRVAVCCAMAMFGSLAARAGQEFGFRYAFGASC
jgi:hypothetical protein